MVSIRIILSTVFWPRETRSKAQASQRNRASPVSAMIAAASQIVRQPARRFPSFAKVAACGSARSASVGGRELIIRFALFELKARGDDISRKAEYITAEEGAMG